jgi:hypothetical protein
MSATALQRDVDAAFDGLVMRLWPDALREIGSLVDKGFALADIVVIIDAKSNQAHAVPRDIAAMMFMTVGGITCANLATEPDPGGVWFLAFYGDRVVTSMREVQS